jgi:O-antigen/teichoic acid export membrane protein
LTSDSPTAAGAAAPASATPLRKLALRSGAWSVGGNVANEGLRLGGNLVLTRLLFPEAFGLMALVQVAMRGVQMFSDIGLRGSVVHHPHGEDPVFLDTTWTLQILRGLLVAAIAALLAWPMAAFYDEPRLLTLIPVVALGALMAGFRSTAALTLVRRMLPERRVLMEVGVHAASLMVMIAWAWMWPSVWALVGGGLVGAALHMVLSHRLLIPGYRNRLAWEPEAARAIYRFGRWIFLATAMTFLLSQGDRIVLGKFMSLGDFGVYSIAFFLAQGVTGVLQVLSGQVLFPLYRRLIDLGPAAALARIARMRRLLLAGALPPLCVLAVFGADIVHLLYDERYAGAGWMLQILAVGMIGSVMVLSAERVLTAHGNSFAHMLLQAGSALLLLAGMALGGWLGGVRGLLIGLSAARLLAYVPLVILIRPYGVWMPRLDAAAFLLSGGAIALGWIVRGMP